MTMKEELYQLVIGAATQYEEYIFRELISKAVSVASKGSTRLEETLKINDADGAYCFTEWSEACGIGRNVCAMLNEEGILNDFYACDSAGNLTLTFKLYWGDNEEEEFLPYFDDVEGEDDDEW